MKNCKVELIFIVFCFFMANGQIFRWIEGKNKQNKKAFPLFLTLEALWLIYIWIKFKNEFKNINKTNWDNFQNDNFTLVKN